MPRTLLNALADRARLAAVTACALAVGAGGAFAVSAPAEPVGIATVAQRLPASAGAPTPGPTAEPAPEGGCPDGLRNHGEYVSSVARSAGPGPGHGEAVSAAARSECGKRAPKAERGTGHERVRGHEREGHPGRGPGRP